jgi:hypothetical protein
LIPVIATLSLLGVGTPSAQAAECGWEHNPGENYYYLNANYGGDFVTPPLVIEIDGDATEFQAFFVGETVTITSHLHAIAQSCSGWGNEAYSIATLEVSGPSGPDSATTGDIYDWSDGCAETDHAETLSISYALPSTGTHTVYMNSNAQISQMWGVVAVEKICEAELSFVVVDFSSVGDCISTLLDTECGGMKGSDRAVCAKDQIGYCHSLFAVPSAHN